VGDVARADDIEAGSALEFQQRWWRLERVVWAVMTLVLIAALAGAFGRGTLARASAGARGGPLWVEYERLARFRTPTTLQVHLGGAALRGPTTSIVLRGDAVGRLPVQRVVPQPVTSVPVSDGTLYTFQLAAPTDSATVRFVLEPGRAGRSRATVAATGAPAVALSQFVYP
jgi:hypothetical protein